MTDAERIVINKEDLASEDTTNGRAETFMRGLNEAEKEQARVEVLTTLKGISQQLSEDLGRSISALEVSGFSEINDDYQDALIAINRMITTLEEQA